MNMYESKVLHLPPDFEGEVIATLVSRRAESSRRAVLYIHGFTDYFFQDHLADHYVNRGIDFYALDLRKYGRSLLPHQTRGLIRSVTEYFAEIDEAVRVIRQDHDSLTINAHSTGGLVAALWADRVRGRGLLQGLVLNSPFLDLNVPAPIRLAADLLKTPMSYSTKALPLGGTSVYGQTLHRSQSGEWDYDLELKPLGGFSVHATWLAAIRRAQRRLHAGLNVDVPVLVLAAVTGLRVRDFSPEAQSADIVLDPRHIARWSTSIGPHVTCVRIPDGIHDLVLSAEPARKQYFAEVDRWSAAYLYQGNENNP